MKLHDSTVSPTLLKQLRQLMSLDILRSFRLVGGTALSLQLGHRESVDIDLFTDATYGNVDFELIEDTLKLNFPFVSGAFSGQQGMGLSCLIGRNDSEAIKLDLFYTDHFVFPELIVDGIRMADIKEIAAMKLEVIGHDGRKKDFWDLHELLDHYSLEQMINFYEKRYPYSYSRADLLEKLIDFHTADDDFEPRCLKAKYWQLIKLDLEEVLKTYKPTR
jgi:predicted nucleotidyltransferase